MAITGKASSSSIAPSEPNYGDLCDLAVQLNLALLKSDVLKLASKYLMSTLPSITFSRYVHNLTKVTETVIIRSGGSLERERSARPPKVTAGTVVACLGPQTEGTSSDNRNQSELCSSSQSAEEPEAASVHAAPMQSKGKAIGTLTVGSSCPDAFAGGRAEAVDIVAAMVAPYMHIHDLRQHLEVKQTCLIDCLPAKVASHMLETRAMGMTPVMQSGDHDGVSSSSDGSEIGDGVSP